MFRNVCNNSTFVSTAHFVSHNFLTSPVVTNTENDTDARDNTTLPVTGADSVHTSDEPLQSSLVSGTRPPPFECARAGVFSLHQQS